MKRFNRRCVFFGFQPGKDYPPSPNCFSSFSGETIGSRDHRHRHRQHKPFTLCCNSYRVFLITLFFVFFHDSTRNIVIHDRQSFADKPSLFFSIRSNRFEPRQGYLPLPCNPKSEVPQSAVSPKATKNTKPRTKTVRIDRRKQGGDKKGEYEPKVPIITNEQ